jgi:hypothetical protein
LDNAGVQCTRHPAGLIDYRVIEKEQDKDREGSVQFWLSSSHKALRLLDDIRVQCTRDPVGLHDHSKRTRQGEAGVSWVCS